MRRGELLHTSCKRPGGVMFWDCSVSVNTPAQLYSHRVLQAPFSAAHRSLQVCCVRFFFSSFHIAGFECPYGAAWLQDFMPLNTISLHVALFDARITGILKISEVTSVNFCRRCFLRYWSELINTFSHAAHGTYAASSHLHLVFMY